MSLTLFDKLQMVLISWISIPQQGTERPVSDSFIHRQNGKRPAKMTLELRMWADDTFVEIGRSFMKDFDCQ